ncbi:hypothetical protein SprV_0200700600 [Sparganum proliferum]
MSIHVCIVQAVLLGEQIVDCGVIFVDPVLMLASCAIEYSYDGRLDCVPQLAPYVLHGGLLVGSRGGDWKGYSSVGVDADSGDEFASPERQAEAPLAIVDALRRTGLSVHNILSDSKGDARVSSLCLRATALEECVAGNNLLQLALF